MNKDYEKLSTERKFLQREGQLPMWFNTGGWQLFKDKYLYKADSFKEQVQRIADTAAMRTPTPDYWAPKFFELLWKGWLSASTPVLGNTGTNRGMSVSCSGQYIGDSIFDFYSNRLETAVLTKNGFGTSGYLGDIRPRGSRISTGGKASGTHPVFRGFVQDMREVAQGTARRGAWAGYLPLLHGDFEEVYHFVKDYPDDANIGWVFTDELMHLLKIGDAEALRRFQMMMKLRMETGKGYYIDTDKANRKRPQMYKDLGLEIKSSNLCTEIMLFQDQAHTYTCVLSSMNLAFYDDWKDTDAVFTATVFLDCIAEDFIQKAKLIPGMEKAVRFTEKGRALGLGTCGFHTYLQKKMVGFEELQAQFINNEIFSHLQKESLRASQWMAQEWGEPEWCKGYGVRNTHRTAIAPTMSTALIMGGVSQGIEPMIGNAFIMAGAGGEVERINPVFLDLLKAKGKYLPEVVKSISERKGSVQHLDFLDDHEKLVFRTAFEIDQRVIIRLASQRQKYICQGQSTNLFFDIEAPEEQVAEIHQMAMEDPNILSLYYVRTESGVQASNGECVACQ